MVVVQTGRQLRRYRAAATPPTVRSECRPRGQARRARSPLEASGSVFGAALQLVELAAELVAERRATRVGRSVALRIRELFGAIRALDRQSDLALGRVGVEHLHLDRLARL